MEKTTVEKHRGEQSDEGRYRLACCMAGRKQLRGNEGEGLHEEFAGNPAERYFINKDNDVQDDQGEGYDCESLSGVDIS
jgi:hypothetical protein